MRRGIIAVALCGAAVASVACAQTSTPDQPKPEQRALRHGDANGDGVVTRAEFLADAAKRFDMMDANKDGQLTAEERKAAHEKMRAERPRGPGGWGPDGRGPGGDKAGGPGTPPPPPGDAGSRGPGGRSGPGGGGGGGGGGMLARLDTNGDSKITRAEYTAPFDRLDANKDGFIDATERAAAPQGGPGGAGGGERLARLDRDGDGKISRAEFEAPFARIDTNNDGVIDASEREAIRTRLGAGGGRRFGGRGPRQDEAQLQPQ